MIDIMTGKQGGICSSCQRSLSWQLEQGITNLKISWLFHNQNSQVSPGPSKQIGLHNGVCDGVLHPKCSTTNSVDKSFKNWAGSLKTFPLLNSPLVKMPIQNKKILKDTLWQDQAKGGQVSAASISKFKLGQGQELNKFENKFPNIFDNMKSSPKLDVTTSSTLRKGLPHWTKGHL